MSTIQLIVASLANLSASSLPLIPVCDFTFHILGMQQGCQLSPVDGVDWPGLAWTDFDYLRALLKPALLATMAMITSVSGFNLPGSPDSQ
ncbi:hypothetical protein ABBQ32_010034 [Trebouxia sp. C0010 RCD-2024]